jgi:hypothetical protein
LIKPRPVNLDFSRGRQGNFPLSLGHRPCDFRTLFLFPSLGYLRGRIDDRTGHNDVTDFNFASDSSGDAAEEHKLDAVADYFLRVCCRSGVSRFTLYVELHTRLSTVLCAEDLVIS